ncbi:MAG: sugar transferase [Oscillospiraceae bacterium]|nr:sugar transferase [Oscillospiraceae bacterium]
MAVTEEKRPQTRENYVITEEEMAGLTPVDVSAHPYAGVKRVLDAVLAAIGLLVLLLPIAIIAVIIYVDDPGKVIFAQRRVGLGGKQFRVYKFRTMKLSTPKYMATSDVVDPNQYITRVGKVLRKLSLDEIPQLWNVLKGDMSLVGPRPLIPSEEQIHIMRSRFGVYTTRPGVTGLAQVNGRDTVLPADKVRYDWQYVEGFGFGMDMKILLSTIPKVFAGSGVVEGGKKKK